MSGKKAATITISVRGSAGAAKSPEITYVGPKSRAYLWIGDERDGCFMTVNVPQMRELQRILDAELGPAPVVCGN